MERTNVFMDRDKIKILHDLVLLEQGNSLTEIGGIYLPEQIQRGSRCGVVVGIGRDIQKHPEKYNVKLGDAVIYHPNSAMEIHDHKNNKKYHLIKETNLIVKVVETNGDEIDTRTNS